MQLFWSNFQRFANFYEILAKFMMQFFTTTDFVIRNSVLFENILILHLLGNTQSFSASIHILIFRIKRKELARWLMGWCTVHNNSDHTFKPYDGYVVVFMRQALTIFA